MKIRRVQSPYSQEQLTEYLERIRWSGPPPEPTPDSLTLLMRKHLTSIPFSNSFIVYEDPIADLDAQELFERLVRKRGGSFCFGQNLLFLQMLRAIGFRCYSTAARVNAHHSSSEAIKYGGLTHMAVFVSFETRLDQPDETSLYLADVGFGSMRFTKPLLISDGAITRVSSNEEHRLLRMQHPASALEPEHADADSPVLPLGSEYGVQYRSLDSDGHPAFAWRTCYAFTLNEMTMEDYATLHFRTCHAHEGFTSAVKASVLLATSDGIAAPLGKLTLFNDTLRRYFPSREVEEVKLQTEAERLRVLREEFGLGNLPLDAEATIRKKGLALA